MNDDDHILRSMETTSQVIDGEAVVLDFETDWFYSFDRVATALWAALEGGPVSLASLTGAAASRWDLPPTEVRPHLESFVAELEAVGLVTLGDGEPRPVEVGGDVDWAPPTFERHERLDRLMLSGE